jgi:hypothetical protein
MEEDRPDLLVKRQLNTVLSRARPVKSSSGKKNSDSSGSDSKSGITDTTMDYKAYRQSMGLATNILESPAKKS